jgi:hypothetical protein
MTGTACNEEAKRNEAGGRAGVVDNAEMSRLQISRPAAKDKLYSLSIEQERVSCQVKESIRSLSVTNESMRWSRISRRCIRLGLRVVGG